MVAHWCSRLSEGEGEGGKREPEKECGGPEGIKDVDVNLGAIESTISGVELPTTLAGIVVELRLEGSLGRVPGLNVAEVLLSGASRELEAEVGMRAADEEGEKGRT